MFWRYTHSTPIKHPSNSHQRVTEFGSKSRPPMPGQSLRESEARLDQFPQKKKGFSLGEESTRMNQTYQHCTIDMIRFIYVTEWNGSNMKTSSQRNALTKISTVAMTKRSAGLPACLVDLACSVLSLSRLSPWRRFLPRLT